MYGQGNNTLIEFDGAFDFCHLIFVIVDLFETSRNAHGDIRGFVDTKKSNKITEYLNDERVCLYLRHESKEVLIRNMDTYLERLDLVSQSNKNYSIDIDSLFSKPSEDQTKFEESKILDYEFIKEGEYLYEFTNFEKEYLEDLKER